MKTFWAVVFSLTVAALAALGAEPVKKSSVKPPSNADCLTCHSDSAAKNAKGASIFVAKTKFEKSVHGQAGVACVDCHADLAKAKDFPHTAKLAPVNCASCHDAAPAAHPFHPGMAMAARGSGSPEAACSDCHGTHDIGAVKDPAFAFAPPKDAEACGNCHSEQRRQLASSEHGRALARGASAPDCLSCHRSVVTAMAAKNPLERRQAQERLCVSCHMKNSETAPAGGARRGFVASYEASVHGQALKHGNGFAATCVDCHGAHEVRHGFEASSPVNKMHVSEVCGRCHGAEAKQYVASVHGNALAKKGNRDAPTCTDCHGEHSILSPKNPASPVAARNVSDQVCAPCHSSLRLAQKWNLPKDRTQTFAASYHGLAGEGGQVAVANCASCHGVHDILPSSNPASRIAAGNLAKTCGASGCHPGVNERFAAGKIHVTERGKDSPLIYWIATLYILLIVVVVGGMALHNLLDFLRKSKHRIAVRNGLATDPPPSRRLYLRMTGNERLQHGALLVSFVLLAVTGFMLRYPDAWWVAGIRRLSSRTFDLRSLLHRFAATLMVAASLYHVLYVTFTRRGRQLITDLWWKWSDIKETIGSLKYLAGLTPERPRFGRFSYVEKAEYWALVWGTFVMAATGVVMWFDNTFIGLITKLGYDASRAIHFYEAILATSAILVWHIYFVIFNPDAYPMNTAWLTGTLSEGEMEEEHPRELEEIHASEQAADKAAKAAQEPEKKAGAPATPPLPLGPGSAPAR